MEEKENILQLLQQSQLFNSEMTQQVIQYFDLLNTQQITGLQQALQSEKIILLHFLKGLKNIGDLQYEKIQSMKDGILRKQRIQREKLDDMEAQNSIENLLTTLDNI